MKTSTHNLDAIPLTDLVAETLLECVEASGLSQSEIARRLGTTPAKITDLVKGRRKLTAELAVRIGRLFGTTPEYWLNMQMDQELRQLLAEKGPAIESAVTPLELAS